MTFEEVRKRRLVASKKAKFAAGSQILSETINFVPIASAELRRSGRVVIEGDDAFVTYGPLPYARKQYFDNLRHLGKRGDYQSLGQTERTYSKNYRKAVKTGLLSKSRARWFDHILNDSATKTRIANVYTKAYEAAL